MDKPRCYGRGFDPIRPKCEYCRHYWGCVNRSESNSQSKDQGRDE